MDFGLQGKRAIVTGGSRGIGKAVARDRWIRLARRPGARDGSPEGWRAEG